MSRTRVQNNPGIYLVRDGIYRVVVSYTDQFGRRRQKWMTKHSLVAARAAKRQFLNDVDRGLLPDGGRMTLSEFVERVWLPHVKEERRPATAHAYRLLMWKHILPALGHLKLRDVDGDKIRAFHRTLAATPPLARMCHAVLSSALSYAVRDRHLLAVNPCGSIRPPKVEQKEARHLDLPEARRMLDAVRGDPDLEGAVILGLVGGLRIGEVCSVRWGDVDLDAGAVVVRGSFWGPTKSGKPRGLTLPPAQVRDLRRYKAAQAERLLRAGIRQDDGTFVVSDPIGRQVPPPALRRSFGRFCRVHVFDVVFHSLRHTAAILMLSAGVDVKTAAGRLGHADPGLLLTVYGHFVASADRVAADRIGALLGG